MNPDYHYKHSKYIGDTWFMANIYRNKLFWIEHIDGIPVWEKLPVPSKGRVYTNGEYCYD